MTQNSKIVLGIILAVALVTIGMTTYNNVAVPIGDPAPYRNNTDGNNSQPDEQMSGEPSNARKCTSKGGTWSEQYKECTGIDSDSCRAIGGSYDECASPCRNDPNAQVCIMMCVQVCKL
jgi:hypothetical protein